MSKTYLTRLYWLLTSDTSAVLLRATGAESSGGVLCGILIQNLIKSDNIIKPGFRIKFQKLYIISVHVSGRGGSLAVFGLLANFTTICTFNIDSFQVILVMP